MDAPKSGGGWGAIKYVLDAADRVGWVRLWKAMRSKNACKTCALGMGGQLGGMRNERGHFPEVCKKSVQAMAADMQDGIEGEFFRRYGLAEMASLSSRELESLGRIVRPLYAGPGDSRYREMSWDEAMGRVAERMRATKPEESFFYVSGRSSNEAGFLLQLLARIYGTNHVNNCSYYCHQASGVGLAESIGTGTATIVLEDAENADLLFLIGGNPASNHPRIMTMLMKIRRRGGQVIVINPLRETGLVRFRVPSDLRSLFFGSEIASLYLMPHIGGDLAVLLGIAKAVLAEGREDRGFMSRATEGWEKYRELVEGTSWQEIENASGVSREELERAGAMYGAAKRVVFSWTMGITHHEHGVENVQGIVNLALLRGMVGRAGAGLMPIRGHSNVQGIGSVGVVPKLKRAMLEGMEAEFGLRLPSMAGLDTMGCMEAAEAGRMRFAFCLGGNLFASNPDSEFARRALGRVETVVYLNTTMNLGHVHGRGKETIILPVLARDEEGQRTTQESMFNYVRMSDGGEARHAGPRSESGILCELGRLACGERGGVDWRAMEDGERVRGAISRVAPGFEKIREIGRTGEEFQVSGRTLHTPVFPTESGKAKFASFGIGHGEAEERGRSETGSGGLNLRMMTVRSEGQFNTVVYEERDLYRGQDRRDVILMNAEDMARAGIEENERVRIRSEAGEMRGILARGFDVRAGNAVMYYPEANVLVGRRVDRRSKTPAFKSVRVEVVRDPGAALGREERVQLSLGEKGGRPGMKAC